MGADTVSETLHFACVWTCKGFSDIDRTRPVSCFTSSSFVYFTVICAAPMQKQRSEPLLSKCHFARPGRRSLSNRPWCL